MVRVIVIVSFILLLAAPLLAQDDFPRIEMGMGYSNIGVPCCSTTTSTDNQRHSGFVTQMGLNLTKSLGVENYTGIYGLGNSTTLITNIVGGKAAWRGGGKVVPYGVAGIGIGYITSGYSSSGSFMSTRFGGGIDIPVSDLFSWKVDVSRMSLHLGQTSPTSGTWASSLNFSTGVSFVLSK